MRFEHHIELPLLSEGSSAFRTLPLLVPSLVEGIGTESPFALLAFNERIGETADMALRAAMTGHLVFSTLHTNTAVGAIPRLINLGVAPFLLSSSLLGVMAQRLIRRICQDCRTPTPADP